MLIFFNKLVQYHKVYLAGLIKTLSIIVLNLSFDSVDGTLRCIN